MYSMKTKICNKCKEEKSYDCFGKALDCVGGVRAVCKECMRADDRIKYQLNRETILPIKREKRKEYCLNNTEKVKELGRAYYHKNKVLKGRPEKQSKEEFLRKRKLWRDNNPEKTIAYRKKHRHKRREYEINLRKDPVYKIIASLRNRIYYAIKGSNKSGSSLDFLGIDASGYKEYLECLFDDNMSWENHGSYWHIDHIIPVSYFNLMNKEEKNMAFDFRNTRPLEAKQNISKGNKYSDSIFDILGYDFSLKNLSKKQGGNYAHTD
jgi:hypothetical protein